MLLQNRPEMGRNGAILENRDSSTLEALRASSRTGWTLQAPNWLQTRRRASLTAFYKTHPYSEARSCSAALQNCSRVHLCCSSPTAARPRRSRRQTMQSLSLIHI